MAVVRLSYVIPKTTKTPETGSEDQIWQAILTAEKGICTAAAIFPGIVVCGVYGTGALNPLRSNLIPFFRLLVEIAKLVVFAYAPE